MQGNTLDNGGRNSGHVHTNAVGHLTEPPMEQTGPGGVKICRVNLVVGEEETLAVVARGELSKQLSLMEPNRSLFVRGRLVLHNWRTGNNAREACVLEMCGVDYVN